MKWKETPIEKKIFLIVAIVFTVIMIGFGIDFSKKTSSPWEKPKNEENQKAK
jgi:preprotein translocase subunit SecG